jgi:hypothetical protein
MKRVRETDHLNIEKERQLHKADFVYGMPLPLIDGYIIAFHAADCPRCAFLAQQAIKKLPVEKLPAKRRSRSKK